MASRRDSPLQYVQIDGLVILRIIKHCHEEAVGGSELAQGVLLGLVVDSGQDRILEITNCFPFPRHTDDEVDFDEVQYQMEMMRSLRHVNIDHLHVGWYQSTYLGSFINRALLESQFNYQHSIEESVVLVYDPMRTTKGHLTVKAYRLTKDMMELYKEGDFSPDTISKQKMSYSKMFQEIPIIIRNSHLVNTMLCDLEDKYPSDQMNQYLDLATSNYLEKNTKLLMGCVDELSQDCNKYFNYQRQYGKQQQAKMQFQQKRNAENASRAAKGEPPLPDEDINKIFKPLVPPSRLDNLLASSQVNLYCEQINEFASQSFGKLFMAESLQEKEELQSGQ